MEQQFPLNPEALLQALVELLGSRGAIREVQLLTDAQAEVCFDYHDNWSGGIDFYRLHLKVLPSSYRQVSVDMDSCKQVIEEELLVLLDSYPHIAVDSVNVTPSRILDDASIATTGDLFRRQFPAGLPFGKLKPSLSVAPQQGSQQMSFDEDWPKIAVIREGVYPNLSFQRLVKLLDKPKPLLKAVLPNMNQTRYEKEFFSLYMREYDAWDQEVPILLPQAWIQWHSKTKRDLRSQGSSYATDLYRVDFVAFWNDRRFAILVDDISHYAQKKGNCWHADQELYSKRLKEDRKLYREGWQVFRVSNWEMREGEETILEMLGDLQACIGFWHR